MDAIYDAAVGAPVKGVTIQRVLVDRQRRIYDWSRSRPINTVEAKHELVVTVFCLLSLHALGMSHNKEADVSGV